MASKKTTTKKTSKKAAADTSGHRSSGAKATTKKKTAAKKTAKKAATKKVSENAPARKSAAKSNGKKVASPERTTKSNAAADVAARVLSGEEDKTIIDLGDELIGEKKSVAAQAARVLDEIVSEKPEAVVPIIDRFAKAIGASAKRPAQSAAHALPLMARVAPARVARHPPRLKESFDGATAAGKDGLVRTFAGLCTASVAYQKRLEDVLNKALSEADAKTLIAWTEVVLPALKGEPHARARATVEGRLGRIPKVHAQKIADFLGIRLRLRYR